MANITSSIKNWSTTEASNQPDSTDSATIAGDMRAIQAGVRYLYTQDTIASATTCDLGSKDAGSLTISGTTTITGLGTVSAGIVKRCVFSGALTLTYNATSLILPGNANIVTVAGDTAEFESLGTGNWRCNWYMRDSALPALSGTNSDITRLNGGANGIGIDVAPTARNNCTLQLPNGIGFPATQAASTDANVLDDYEEGTFTPSLTFSTAGDLSVVYSAQVGEYTKIGRDVRASFNVITSTFTHTTASGNLLLSGLPFTSAALSGQVSYGSTSFQGITKANYTQGTAALSQSQSVLTLQLSGSGQSITNAASGDMPSGGSVRIQFTITYAAS